MTYSKKSSTGIVLGLLLVKPPSSSSDETCVLMSNPAGTS